MKSATKSGETRTKNLALAAAPLFEPSMAAAVKANSGVVEALASSLDVWRERGKVCLALQTLNLTAAKKSMAFLAKHGTR